MWSFIRKSDIKHLEELDLNDMNAKCEAAETIHKIIKDKILHSITRDHLRLWNKRGKSLYRAYAVYSYVNEVDKYYNIFASIDTNREIFVNNSAVSYHFNVDKVDDRYVLCLYIDAFQEMDVL